MSNLKSQKLQLNRGFSYMELVLILGILLILLGIGASLLNINQQASLSSTIDIFIADLKEQQVKAMVGDTEGSGALSTYGINFDTNKYTLFRGTYSAGASSNFIPAFPSTIQINNTFSNSQIIFLKGSGEVSDFVDGQNTVTFTDPSGQAKTITVNRYGVIVGIN